MRICFDVDKSSSAGGGGKPYCNLVGFQGADDGPMDVTFFLRESEESCEVVEFHGSGEDLVRLFKKAVLIAEGSVDFIKKQNGPIRPLPCPNCDPLAVYPNPTHTHECAARKFWEGKESK